MRPIALAHALITLWLAIYGLNSLVLTVLYLLHRREDEPIPHVARDDLPHVTVQVPVYNERHVIERVIDHAAALDYPRDRLHVQVLDDSTDETSRLARRRAAFHRERGVDVQVLRRAERGGFKAGALAWGLARAQGDFVAIFDADFCPRSDFLLQTVPHFMARPRLGLLQTRWAYLNAGYSPLTRAQALVFDGYYGVEKVGRSRGGLPLTFNGSGGVWRRRCIEDSGGWQPDTLCEDLDLSYRAHLAGWESLYLPSVEAPAEIPPQMAAFKQQQARWAQGTVQTLRKLALPILRSSRLGWAQKVSALVHLTGYLVFPLVLLLVLISIPLVLLSQPLQIPLGVLAVTCVGPLAAYVISQRELYPSWGGRLLSLPMVILLGAASVWSNTRAVWRGFTRWGGTFDRTPKFRLEERGDRWADSAYRHQASSSVWGEVLLALYALVASAAAWVTGHSGMIPFLLLDAAAFGVAAGVELWQRGRVRGRGLRAFQPLDLARRAQREREGR